MVTIDWNPKKAEDSRKRLMDVMTDEGLLMMSPHFKFPGIGHIKKDKSSDRRTFKQLKQHRPKNKKSSSKGGSKKGGQMSLADVLMGKK